ncbi:hypothetical protein CLOBOL_03793 [Enterocloster bolteae ATCC BAA-613]|uniref:Uncharacterized protein n=1 Tax=Enterocloster bolteae (strain ATCC BAA-613 / DSM 15670 / CCUG 46953 / JCM 12243 / WAL 16351) TaxID=411902 RepID=A8RTU4_ENTBW|nr:hypothetical protein CLOBOL_03793 [Enterocloster bolteae ATCC BAA-613]
MRKSVRLLYDKNKKTGYFGTVLLIICIIRNKYHTI